MHYVQDMHVNKDKRVNGPEQSSFLPGLQIVLPFTWIALPGLMAIKIVKNVIAVVKAYKRRREGVPTPLR